MPCVCAYKNLVQLFSLVLVGGKRQRYKQWNGKCRRGKRVVVAGIETANDGRGLMQNLMRSDRDDTIRYRELPTGLGVRPVLALISCQSVSMPAEVQRRVPNWRLAVCTEIDSKCTDTTNTTFACTYICILIPLSVFQNWTGKWN